MRIAIYILFAAVIVYRWLWARTCRKLDRFEKERGQIWRYKNDIRILIDILESQTTKLKQKYTDEGR